MNLSFVIITILVSVVISLGIWRLLDLIRNNAAAGKLKASVGGAKNDFEPALILDLPEPAQRYFKFTIKPGTPIYTIVELSMTGKLGFGDKHTPNYRAMKAKQILAPPHGLVWRVNAGPISGSDGFADGRSWTRFWLFNLLPVVRVENNADHYRSAFGRVAAEGAFWVPASLLPSDHVEWTAIDANTARATLSYGDLRQDVEITVDEEGRPSQISIQRWSNENAQKIFKEQPFGGRLSNFQEIDGYCLPAHVEGGNLFGTDEYFPFFVADINQVHFPQKGAQ